MIRVTDIDAIVVPGLTEGLSDARINELVENLAAAAKAKWIKLAAKELEGSSMRFDYLNGIQEPVMAPGRATVALVGDVANMVEHGAPSMDMRDILLNPQVSPVVPRNGRGMHETEEGEFYRAIPFRHLTPGSKSTPRQANLGLEMGKAYSDSEVIQDSKRMGREVYKAAKRLKAFHDPYAPASERHLPAGTAGAYPLTSAQTGTPHKTDPYAGMVRKEMPKSGEGTESQYITFRTISTGVQDGSWIRKKIPARRLAEKVSAFVARIAPEAVAALVEGGS